MEIKIHWDEGEDWDGDHLWNWKPEEEKDWFQYEITDRGVYGHGRYGLRGLQMGFGFGLQGFSTLEAAQDAAVKHYLQMNPNASLKQDDTNIILQGYPMRPVLAQISETNRQSPNESLGDRPQIEIPGQLTTRAAGLNPLSAGLQATTGQEMSITQILEQLGRHGCNDVTGLLDISKSSEYPVVSGGFGDVYRGALRNGDPVAIKCLRLHTDSDEVTKSQLKRAARDLSIWSKCNHPNVLGLIGVAQHRNQIAMVAPWMEYGNVRRLISLQPEVDRYNLCAQVSDGVAYLHSVGIVHGDIKGDNVLVSDDITLKLTDFGNAGLQEYTLQFSGVTSKSSLSLNWVPPEMLEEDAKPTVEADVYSLAMTMLEIITGAVPYAGMRESVLVKKIMMGEHPPRPEEYMPLQDKRADLLWSLLTRCWTLDSGKRPNAMEVLDKIKHIDPANVTED